MCEDKTVFLDGNDHSLLLGLFYSFGTLTWFRVMTSPYRASRSHSLDTVHSVEFL